METNLLLQGLLLGFSIALPVGPIGILCIRRTLANGHLHGLFSGLGAATADALYGCIAGFGLTYIADILIDQAVWFRLIGGTFLCYLGIKTILSKPSDSNLAVPSRGLLNAYTSTVFLTLTNPATVLSFAAVFAGLGLANANSDYFSAIILVLGVFMGSALWWLILSGGVSLLRAKFNLRAMKWLNRTSGIILLIFGTVALGLRE